MVAQTSPPQPPTGPGGLVAAAQQHPIVVFGAAFAVLGVLALLRGSRNRARRVAAQAREASRVVSLAGRMLVLAGLITGGQWAVWTAHTGTGLRLAALAVPALFAAHPLTHAVTVTGHSPRPGRR